MNDCYMAHWSRGDEGRLIVSDDTGETVDSVTVPSCGDRPPDVFAGAVWARYPGAEWDEESPGCWSIAVFREQVAVEGKDVGGAL
jgi:hypothetical protein